MNRTLATHRTITIVLAFSAPILIAMGVFMSDFAGRVNFSVGADGIQLEIDGGSTPSD